MNISSDLPLCADFAVEQKHFLPHSLLRAVGVLFSALVSGWVGLWAVGKGLSGLYLRNYVVQDGDTL